MACQSLQRFKFWKLKTTNLHCLKNRIYIRAFAKLKPAGLLTTLKSKKKTEQKRQNKEQSNMLRKS